MCSAPSDTPLTSESRRRHRPSSGYDTRPQTVDHRPAGRWSLGLLKQRKVTVYNGRAHGADRTVTVSGGESGNSPCKARLGPRCRFDDPFIPGFDVDGSVVMTSDEVLDAEASGIRRRHRRWGDRL